MKFQEALKFQEQAKESIQQQQQAEDKIREVEDQLDKANEKLETADHKVKQAQEQEIKAKRKAEEAEKQERLATEKADQAQKDLENAQQALEQAKTERASLKQEVQTLEKTTQDAERKAEEADRKAKEAEKLEQQANQELKEAQLAKAEAEKALSKTNQALEAVRGLSVLAGELRKNGSESASNEALSKAGLSTLIDDWNLKQAWLLAATVEAYQSLGEERQKQAQDTLNNFNSSLDSLNDSQAQIDSGILNQVRAFAYFQAGKLKDEKYLKDAYDALKASNFNPYNLNIEKDVLNERDVENIHYRLIKSRNIDINSSDEIATSFRKHLYDGLDFLLKKDSLDSLKEADIKTWEIMLYIAGQKEDGYLNIKSLKNFSCLALKEIDALWYNYPKHLKHFGFRVQKEIWQNNGSPTIDSPKEKWRKFYIDLGWKTEESGIESAGGYVSYDDLFTKKLTRKKGNLPFSGGPVFNLFTKEWPLSPVWGGGDILFSRCEL